MGLHLLTFWEAVPFDFIKSDKNYAGSNQNCDLVVRAAALHLVRGPHPQLPQPRQHEHEPAQRHHERRLEITANWAPQAESILVRAALPPIGGARAEEALHQNPS